MNDRALRRAGAPDEALAQARSLFPERISAAVRATIGDDTDPVGRQYVADTRELVIAREERPDPIGDHTYSPVRGIVHRHPDRVLFKVASVCAVNCRFCFRKTMLGTPEETLDDGQIEAALGYIAANKSIWEVILTGGDPLILSARRLAAIIRRLESLPHVRIIRIHSRMPVADPGRVNDALCGLIMPAQKPLYFVIHINHAQELSETAVAAFGRMRQAGMILLSQSVLLRGVNDSPEALEELFRRLTALSVTPYYLHHPDRVLGTGHFRVSIARGQQIMNTLRRRLSGIALPQYVLDIPGGYGKMPLDGAIIGGQGADTYILDADGLRHAYPEEDQLS